MSKGQTLPAGFNARRTWRTINRYAPADADAFAAAVWRFAETGEERPPESVDPEEWEEAKAETERLKVARNAGKVGGEAGTGENKARPGNQNARKTQAETQAETQATRGRDETETKTETEREEESIKPEYENETSVSGFALKVSPADAMHARLRSGEAGAVAVALEWAGETGNALARNTLAKYRRMIGGEAFAEEVETAVAEAQAGEEPRNRGASLVARLKKRAEPAPESSPPDEKKNELGGGLTHAGEPSRMKQDSPHTGPQTELTAPLLESETPPALVPSHADDEDTPPAFASVAEAKRAPADETPAEAQRRNRDAIARDKREHPERWGLSPTPAKRETKPARRSRRAPATPPEAQGEPEPPTDAAPGLTAKQARILAWVEEARCSSPQEARAVALNYPEEGGATAEDADAVLAAWEAKRAEAV